MLDPALLRDNLETVRDGLAKRGVDLTGELEDLATLETRRRRILPEIEALRRDQNASGDEVARAKRQGLDASKIHEASRQRAQQIKRLIEDLGVNLAGVEVIMKLTERIREMEQEIEGLRGELAQKQRGATAESTANTGIL